ncbi:16S rRNA (guanine(966)-N(2))-methyltransferase RsmD [bacterium]|nr:16S rRNA (guanine(966)-N(2))-methyltransferase RsmD [bacterium]
MQILAGRYKGVSIQTSAKYDYRPTQSKVRKSLFDILGDLSDKTAIDLFAGSGILGFEALSRMAKSVIFVETNKKLVELLYKNSIKIDAQKCIIRKMDAFIFLKEKQLVDLIMVDPPYGQKDLNLLIELCYNRLNTDGTLVLETSLKDEHIKADSERIYGSTRLSFWRKQ